MAYDLKDDDDLRRAWQHACQSVNIDESIKAFVQRFYKVTREKFIKDHYQLDLWDSNPICEAKHALRVNVDKIIQDRDFLN